MRPILIAAGRGSRLGQSTDRIPKNLVPVMDRPLLHLAMAEAGWQARR